jgi:hypothetical protein
MGLFAVLLEKASYSAVTYQDKNTESKEQNDIAERKFKVHARVVVGGTCVAYTHESQ